MKVNRAGQVAGILLCLFLIHSQAVAQFQITRSVLGNGGSPQKNGQFQLNSTVGQTLTGQTSEATFINHLGFWAVSAPVPADSDSVTWLASINVMDAGAGSGQLLFGQAATATADLDTSLGERELPPPPPAGTFFTRFRLPVDPPIFSQKDIRSDGEEAISWRFDFQPSSAGYPVRVSWESDDLPAGDFSLRDEVTGSIINVDMKLQESAQIDNSAMSSLIIVMTRFNWKCDLLVSDAGQESITLSFGQAFGADDGLNKGLGEADLPPMPPSGVMDARFILPVTPTIESPADFRSQDEEEILWKFIFRPGTSGYPMTLRWNSENLPAKSFTLKDEVTNGDIVRVNMKDQDSYTLTNSGISSLLIEMSGVTCAPVAVMEGWNLVSVPVESEDQSAKTLFPTATSNAFRFDNGYVIAPVLTPGEGYWLKFARIETVEICGQLVSERRVPVVAGWNIIGPFDTDVMTSEITSEPAGIVESSFFGFNGGYQIATTLQAGKGYWVKVRQNGTLNLASPVLHKGDNLVLAEADGEMLRELPQLYFKDSAGGRGTLYLTAKKECQYELPPLPPTGVFDIRFSGDTYVGTAGAAEIVIQASFPVTVRCENLADQQIYLRDTLDGTILNESLLSGKEFTITKPMSRLLLGSESASPALPTAYELGQNYPNPFNPATKITFALPEAGHVRISVYNLLGEKVVDLVDEPLEAGYHDIQFDSEGLSSGVYFYLLQTDKFKEMKKMILMR
ncbi:T9SS type A sorting domain-containing protein [candidate division KSB1 bacterium]|nr:T9SS type A sorting domain-containing protein [candidate division KSB1 bacterium]